MPSFPSWWMSPGERPPGPAVLSPCRAPSFSRAGGSHRGCGRVLARRPSGSARRCFGLSHGDCCGEHGALRPFQILVSVPFLGPKAVPVLETTPALFPRWPRILCSHQQRRVQALHVLTSVRFLCLLDVGSLASVLLFPDDW